MKGKRCDICGNFFKITFPCSRCRKDVCKACFHIQAGICTECMTIHYAEKYATKILRYELGLET